MPFGVELLQLTDVLLRVRVLHVLVTSAFRRGASSAEEFIQGKSTLLFSVTSAFRRGASSAGEQDPVT